MEVKIQFTLTISAGKWIIAQAIAEKKEIKNAYNNGTLLLMGGTTVSAVTELVTGSPIRISGRITKRGTVCASSKVEGAHTLLIHKGQKYDYEKLPDARDILSKMKEDDFIISGANAYDSQGYAAIMSGAYGLGSRTQLLAPMYSEGAKILIAAGLEKQIPGTINEAIKQSGRNLTKWSMGMPVGLIPLVGDIINEIVAIEMITGIKPYVIGKGGINGAEGSATMVARGNTEPIEKIIKLIEWADRKGISGINDSIITECYRGCASCSSHRTCCYKSGKMFIGI